MDGGHGVLGRMVGRDALDGQAQDHARLLVGLGLRPRLGIADDGCRLVRDLVLQAVKQFGLRLVGRHAGHALEATAHLLLGGVQVMLAALDLPLHGRDLVLSRIERLDTAVERLLALGNAVLGGAHFAQPLLVLGLGLLLVLQGLVLRFDERFAAQRLGLSFRIGYHAFGLLRRTLRGRVDQEPGNDEAESDADDGPDDEPQCFGHTLPLS